MTRTCTFCKETKPESEFYVRKNRYGTPVVVAKCKECHREGARRWYWNNLDKVAERKASGRHTRTRLKHFYGISPEDLERMLADQEGCCAICGVRPPGDTPYQKLQIDHCHTEKATRALLCKHCNRGLGHFQDNPELLEKAALYVRLHRPI